MARLRALAASIPGLFSTARILSLRLDKFRVDGDGTIITHQKTVGLKCGIPHKSEVFAIDFGYCGGTDTGVAHESLPAAVGLSTASRTLRVTP